jgi:hypothetical protein
VSYNTKVYNEQGGDTLVVASGGVIDIKTGGAIRAGGTQAAAIADATAITGGEAPTEAEHNALITKLNAVLAAMRGAGIIASS